jgi:hypothetical protein
MPINKFDQMAKAQTLIQSLVNSNFYGELNVKFEHGNIVHLRQITNLKIELLGEEDVVHK